ncbi:sciellin [Tautogolabrus adspersus]
MSLSMPTNNIIAAIFLITCFLFPYSDIYDVDSKSYSYSKPDSSYEYTSITSPTSYSSTTYRSSSRSDDSLTDPIYSKSSKNVYASSDRAVLEKDLCSYCRKPFTGDAKMVLDDMKINCHATCFKCEMCNNTLAHLKAGDSMWVYKHKVHCENCFESTRERWRR